ncbi:MAG: hypothetical protein QG639_566 [Patescibacteria group bacterium]|nr:hypothetical protein [Patescibacteria group bacterium]
MIEGLEISAAQPEQPAQQSESKLNHAQLERVQNYKSNLEMAYQSVDGTTPLTPEQQEIFGNAAFNILDYSEDGKEQQDLDALLAELNLIRPVPEEVRTAMQSGLRELIENREIHNFRRQLGADLRQKFVAELLRRGYSSEDILVEVGLLDDIDIEWTDEKFTEEVQNQMAAGNSAAPTVEQ